MLPGSDKNQCGGSDENRSVDSDFFARDTVPMDIEPQIRPERRSNGDGGNMSTNTSHYVIDDDGTICLDDSSSDEAPCPSKQHRNRGLNYSTATNAEKKLDGKAKLNGLKANNIGNSTCKFS